MTLKTKKAYAKIEHGQIVSDATLRPADGAEPVLIVHGVSERILLTALSLTAAIVKKTHGEKHDGE